MNTTATKIVLSAFGELSPEEMQTVATEILKRTQRDIRLAQLLSKPKKPKKYDPEAMARDFLDNFKYRERKVPR